MFSSKAPYLFVGYIIIYTCVCLYVYNSPKLFRLNSISVVIIFFLPFLVKSWKVELSTSVSFYIAHSNLERSIIKLMMSE